MKPSMDRGLSRRQFVQRAAAGLSLLGLPERHAHPRGTVPERSSKPRTPITIARVGSDFERDPLVRPFGFKGGYLTEIWQVVSMLESSSGTRKVGLGTQSVLWSDAAVFAEHSEAGGNALMYALTEYALQRAKGMTFQTPIELLDALLEDVHAYGKKITGRADLRETFALNALVGVDNAAWLLYAEENELEDFDTMIPERYRPGLSYKHEKVAAVPTFAFTVPPADMGEAVEAGHFFLKIKLGHPGTQEEMLERDKAHVSAIHEAIGGRTTEHTADGQIPYYFDPNGRYESKETLLRLLDHARAIGAFDQIAVLEEPFPEDHKVEVGDLGVLVAADESAHTDRDVIERIELGYGAMALKAAAKTLSMTMKMAQVAHERGVPAFVADLTVNPILVEWNKNVAARLAPIPGFRVGVMEVNGHQNYARWAQMLEYHPCSEAPWVYPQDGMFVLDDHYWQTSGCIFFPSEHYMEMFEPPDL